MDKKFKKLTKHKVKKVLNFKRIKFKNFIFSSDLFLVESGYEMDLFY